MSERWPGGIVRSTPVTPTGPLQNGTAPGMWTLDQANYWIKQGLWPTAGNFLAVEDVFSTYLYTGNGSTQTITNGINLSGQGGLVWCKQRAPNAGFSHALFDTSRGVNRFLISDGTNAELTASSNTLTAFNSNGFSLGADTTYGLVNQNSCTYASWTFREAANFFDVVTYTGNGSTQSISHNLGTAPGTIIVKSYGAGGSWIVYHQSLGAGSRLFLNATNAATTTVPATIWGNNTTTVAPTSTAFTTGSALNANGDTYVAYLFAHNTTSDGIIQCGSYTGTGAVGNFVNLGWEPQWVLIKDATYGDDWYIYDNMRGASLTSQSWLWPNSTSVEGTSANNGPSFGATGFTAQSTSRANNAGSTYVYIAIRRGPMKTPTLGTTVFSPLLSSATGTTLTSNFSADMILGGGRQSGYETGMVDRLRGFANTTTGNTNWLITQNSNAELSVGSAAYYNAWNTTTLTGPYLGSGSFVNYVFRRAPSFFDVVCYTGTGSARTINHNLGVAPELIIIKCRSNGTTAWMTYCSALSSPNDKYLFLNQNSAVSTVAGTWKTPTATTFGMDISFTEINNSGFTYVAYLFASCPGVSKVGSYTGTGALQTINCGFTTGARFVLIKRTDSTGDWFVWNSATGISGGNDPYILLNTTGGEVTGTNYVDTDTTGFKVTAAAPAGINANGGTYIFLAIS